MTKLIRTGFALAALMGATSLFAQSPVTAGKSAKKVSTDQRAAKARRALAHDLHWRGSPIPPAVSADGRWSR